jgi:hypothetical protein
VNNTDEDLKIHVFPLTWKECSEEAYNNFKEVFENYGIYMGDVLVDFYGENGTDTYIIYIAKRKLSKDELKKYFYMCNLMDQDKKENVDESN